MINKNNVEASVKKTLKKCDNRIIKKSTGEILQQDEQIKTPPIEETHYTLHPYTEEKPNIKYIKANILISNEQNTLIKAIATYNNFSIKEVINQLLQFALDNIDDKTKQVALDKYNEIMSNTSKKSLF